MLRRSLKEDPWRGTAMGMEKPCGEPKQPSQLSVWSSNILKASFCLSAKPPVQCNHSVHSRYKKNHMTKPEIVGIPSCSVCACARTRKCMYTCPCVWGQAYICHGMQLGQRTTSDTHPCLPLAVQCCIHHASWLRSLQGSFSLHLPTHHERTTLPLPCVTTSGFTWTWGSEPQPPPYPGTFSSTHKLLFKATKLEGIFGWQQ